MRGALRTATFGLLASVLCIQRSYAEDAPKTGVYRATTDRVAMRFGFYSPTGRVGSVDLSEVNRWVATAVEENTDLDVTELDGQVVDRCVESSGARKRLTCLVEESSEEWIAMRTALPQNYSEVKHRLRSSRTHPRYVLILSAALVEGGDRLSALLIDVEDALMRVHSKRSRSEQPNAQDLADVEDEISRFSVLARPPIQEGVDSSEELKAYVQQLIEEQLREAFTAQQRWRPFGSIEVDVGVEDAFSIELDGVSIGATVEGKATVVDVRPGRRRLALRNEDYEEIATMVMVETAKSALFETAPIKKPSQLIFVLRQGVLWGGVMAAVAGASLMVYAAVKPQDRINVCTIPIGSPGECEDPYLRFGEPKDSFESTSNGGGPPILPLGYSLVGLGTAWMLGPLLDDDDERIPWIEAVVGLVVFGASFGISLALDGGDSVCGYHKSC